ncbi:hypothetical protein ABI_23180 [Asticcacaulis biprosthecium C19]|uniref:Uncharacterized protein n=1 Tax=Asticcacaulis biprosthecium C19 TaxID=715226 RepID=F4QNJ8_9CAUL|nr:hypothetical protein [Asticcacaulis biprosthecium]EGF90906.1 hypothetical protein ABI_23180 [Asticcacaulis biprosthecium C19]
MNSNGRNPARRNRKIGTKGHGSKRRKFFGIPNSDVDPRRFYEKLIAAVELEYVLNSHRFTVVVEPTAPGWKYYLSVHDVVELLKLIPEADRKGLSVIAFRQPKRKERIFSPVWGRMAYWAEFGRHSGTSVVIEAQPLDYSYRLKKDVGPGFAKELDALRRDGHRIETTSRYIEISCPPEAIRATQLFRTLPHEIGHHLDYCQKVEDRYDRDEGELRDLTSLYFARPQREREAFADRYADEVMGVFRRQNIVPFPPLPNRGEEKLNADWFYFDTASI